MRTKCMCLFFKNTRACVLVRLVCFSVLPEEAFLICTSESLSWGGGGEKIIPHCLKRDNPAEAGSGVVAKARESKISDSRAIGGDI